MITGDNSLTACKGLLSVDHRACLLLSTMLLTICSIGWLVVVASDLQIVTKPVLLLSVAENGEQERPAVWLSIDEKLCGSVDTPIDTLAKSFDFCLSGAALEYVINSSYYTKLLPFVAVYARVSPAQKVC
jgi:magnesium-transporting ATPase (P-type)